jgi:hypothetical protein
MAKNLSMPLWNILLPFVSLAISCSQGLQSIESIAASELGKQYSIIYNTEKTFALCDQKPMDGHARQKLKFIVIEVANHNIVHRGSYQLGYVKWLDEDSLKVYSKDNTSDESDSINSSIVHLNHPEQ